VLDDDGVFVGEVDESVTCAGGYVGAVFVIVTGAVFVVDVEVVVPELVSVFVVGITCFAGSVKQQYVAGFVLGQYPRIHLPLFMSAWLHSVLLHAHTNWFVGVGLLTALNFGISIASQGLLH
jgi:hypothetical protein